MMSSIEEQLDAAGTELDRTKSELTFCDVWIMSASSRGARAFVGQRAWAYVSVAAVIERSVRAIIGEVLDALNARALKTSELRLSLLAMLCHPTFESLAEVRKLDLRWRHRCELLETTTSETPATFSLQALPLDGKTVQPRHLDVIWRVFGFRGTPLPSPLHRMTLIEIAELRNKIAHGEESPEIIARGKTTAEALKMVGRVEDIIEHLAVSADEYLKGQEYIR